MNHIQLINIAKNQLGISEDAYRALLKRVTKKDSLRAMTPRQLNAVYNEMIRIGFKFQPKTRSVSKSLAPQHVLIKSLWQRLAERGEVRDCSDQALNKFVKRQTGIEALQWLDSPQSSRVIEHLKQWLQRIESGGTI